MATNLHGFLDLLVDRHVRVGFAELVLEFLAVLQILADVGDVEHVLLLADHAFDATHLRLKVVHVQSIFQVFADLEGKKAEFDLTKGLRWNQTRLVEEEKIALRV